MLNDKTTSKQTVAPLLVKLYDTHRLYAQEQGDKVAAREKLSDAVSSLVTTEGMDKDSSAITDIVISLIAQAEIELKQALAEKLAMIPGAPSRLMIRLANEEISVAQTVLENSEVLCDMDLIYVIQSHDETYHNAIARRKTMSDSLMNTLADAENASTIKIMLENNNIVLNAHVMTAACNKLPEAEDLAMPLLQRKEITEALVRNVYEQVGDSLKLYIAQNFDQDITPKVAEQINIATDDVIQEATASDTGVFDPSQMPSKSIISSADIMKRNRLLKPDLLTKILKKGQMQSFVAYFASYCDLPLKMMLSILQQENGQGLAICCRAYDITKADFTNYFLMTQSLRDREKLIDQRHLAKALSYYDRIDRSTAEDILSKSRLPKNSFIIDM